MGAGLRRASDAGGVMGAKPLIESSEAYELRESLGEHLQLLKPRDQELLWVMFVEDVAASEVAKELGVCKQTVYQRLRRAQRIVRRALSDDFPELESVARRRERYEYAKKHRDARMQRILESHHQRKEWNAAHHSQCACGCGVSWGLCKNKRCPCGCTAMQPYCQVLDGGENEVREEVIAELKRRRQESYARFEEWQRAELARERQ